MMAVSAPVLVTSCSEDDYYNVDINGVPEASAYVDDVRISVDQETNTAYFEFTIFLHLMVSFSIKLSIIALRVHFLYPFMC